MVRSSPFAAFRGLFEVMPYWEETIAPALKAGKTVFVAAHGNSIRAIVKMWLDPNP